MRVLQRLGIRANLDSLAQLEVWLELGATEAGIRINAASLGNHVSEDRIGIDVAEVAEALAITARFGSRLTGLHIYVGTNYQRHDQMLPTLESVFDLAASLKNLSYVNIGGGIGINYSHEGPRFDILAFGEGIVELAKTLGEKLERNVEVIFEPGRCMTAECGTFLTSVTDVKKLGERRFAGVDGSIAVFPRPFHHPESPHRIRRLNTELELPRSLERRTKTFVVGRTTFSRDILGVTSLPDDLSIGDFLAFDDAGAYSQSMASRFLGQPEPNVVFLDD
jgi:diaminopimelate decarboxylase